MNKENITTFDQIPYAISKILNELEAIKEELALGRTKTNLPTTAPEKKILVVDDICKLLGMKKSTVYSQTHLGKIPHYKVNGRVYFDADEINNWIHINKIKTVKELQNEANQQLRK
jgi:excisionase family DNA binding protein